MRKALGFLKWAAIALLLIAIDQAAKLAAREFLSGRPAIELLGDFVTLSFVQNHGGFLSLGAAMEGPIWWLTLVAVPIAMTVAVIAYVTVKKADDPFYRWLTVFFASGGIGNLIDRIARGSVIDFLNFGIGPHFRTGIMNVADLYIAVCVVMVLARAFNERKAQGANAAPGERGEQAPSANGASAENSQDADKDR